MSLLFGTAVTNVSETEISWNVDSACHDLIIYFEMGKLDEKYVVQLMHYLLEDRTTGRKRYVSINPFLPSVHKVKTMSTAAGRETMHDLIRQIF
jgi:hypothetical protein